MEKKQVLVTGANGFIGQHICRNLINNGYQVRGLRHEKRPLYFISESEIEWVEGDLVKKDSIKDITSSIEIVIHAAAIPRNDLQKTWDDFYSVNVQGTLNLMEEAAKSNIKRFIFLSTVEAAGYGDGINPRKESDIPKPCNNYGKSKLEAEKHVLSGNWSFERTVLRLPMTYGPGTFLIVPKLFGMVKKGFYPFIGSGKTLMEFCYVGNTVEAIRLSMESKAAPGNLFYISDERSYTIKEVIDAIAVSLHKKYIPIHIPKSIAYLIALGFEILAKVLPFPPIVSPYSKKPFFTKDTVDWTTRNVNVVSTEKIRSQLGYHPVFSINEGCKQTALWLENN